KLTFLLLALGITMMSTSAFAQKSSGEPGEGLLDVYIPTAFTPDMNGLNDLFRPVIHGGEIDHYEFVIIDRMGKEVFASKDPNEAWNGTVQGSKYLTAPALFIYYLKVKSATSLEYQVFKGHVVVVR